MDHRLTIERVNVGDAERLRDIRLRSLRDSPGAFGTTFEEAVRWSSESWNRQLEQLPTFVATSDGLDVGVVRGALHDHLRDTGYLISMWVAPEARRQGIGSALVDAVVQWARAQGLSRLFLNVHDQNTPAMALYMRMGFIPDGEVGTLPPPRNHVREVRLVMSL